MPRSNRQPQRGVFRRREVEIEGEVFEIVWDGRKGAPSLLPPDPAAGVVDFRHEYEITGEREAA